MAGERTLKLIRLQHTQNVLEGLKSESGAQEEEQQLPKAVGAEHQSFRIRTQIHTPQTRYFALHNLRRQAEEKNLSLMRERLEDMIDVLSAYDTNTGLSSTLKYQMNRMLNRLNLNLPINISDFEALAQKFSQDRKYMVALQDEINNRGLDLGLHPEDDQPTRPPSIVDFRKPEKPREDIDTNQPSQESPTLPNLPSPSLPPPPPRIIPQIPRTNREKYKDKETYAEHKRVNASNRKTEAERLWEERKKLALRPAGSSGGSNLLADWLGKKLAEKIAQSKLGQAVARNFIDPLKQAVQNSRAWQAVAPRIQPLINAYNTIAAPFKAIGNAFGAPGRWMDAHVWNPLGNWLGSQSMNALRAGLNQAANLIDDAILYSRPFISPIVNFFRNWGSHIAGGTAGIGTSIYAAGQGALAILGTISAGAWVFGAIIIGLVAFVIWDTYDSTSECGKAGRPLISKRVVNGSPDTNGDIVLNSGETEIEYAINFSYQIKCGANFDIEIRDTIPKGTEYVTGSAKKPAILEYASQGAAKITYDSFQEGNTLVWKIKGLPNRTPIDLNFRVKPIEDNIWIINEATAKFTIYNSSGLLSLPLNLTGPSRGLMCVDNLDERLLRIFEEAGVAANVSPSMLYAIAKAENGGNVTPWSLDGKQHAISPCGAHGLMQIQHPLDGKGENYARRCVEEAGGTSDPPETWNGLAAKYNEVSGGNLVDPDSDKDSIFGAAFYIKDSGWPSSKGYMDQLTDLESANIARRYLGAGNVGYLNQTINSYNDAFSKQGSCGGGVGPGTVTQQPVQGGANAQ